MEIGIYRKIDAFKTEIQKNLINDKDYPSFRLMLSSMLMKHFGYKYVIVGHLNGSKKRELGLDITTQNLSTEFVQKFYSSSFLADSSFLVNDVITFSQTPNYKKRLIYKELLFENGLDDFMIVFLIDNGLYLGYIIVFSEEQYGRFRDSDIEIAENTRMFIGYSYSNYREFINVKLSYDALVSQGNYYPIGLVLIKDYNIFMFANNIARDYMNDLGIGNEKFFPVFFNNYILPEIKYQLVSHGKQTVVRYRNYVFSIVSARPVTFDGKTFEQGNMVIYIYIMRDELTSYENVKNMVDDWKLSKKESQIVEQIRRGKNNKQIAEGLDISINTVRAHVQNIYKKADVTSRAQLLFKIAGPASQTQK